MPTADEVSVLRLGPATPIVQIVRTALAGRRPVETNDMVLDGSAYVLAYTFTA